MAIANLYFNFNFRARGKRIIDQADAARGQSRGVEILARRDYDLARIGPNLAHIEPLAGRDSQTATLTDGEAMHSSVFGEAISRAVDYRASANLLGRARAFDEARIVAVWNKPNFLALRLVGIGEDQVTRAGANFGLGDRAERKKRAREFGLSEREKKIRLILGIVGGAQQMEAAVGAVFNPGVVSGRDKIRCQRMRAGPQTIELDFAIAHHARIRSAPAEIFGDKVIDHAGGEVGAQIDHVKRKIHPLGDPARIFEILMRATSAATLCASRRDGLSGLRPNTHPHSHHPVAT